MEKQLEMPTKIPDNWEAYLEPDILGKLAHDAKEQDIFRGKDRGFLMQMKQVLKNGRELTLNQRNYVVSLLKQAKQEDLLDYLDETPSSESTKGGPGVKEQPRDVDLHKKIGPPQIYDDDL